ncbi:MAG: hypothetical protein ABF575_10205 [Liquorilactobacillus hordei]|uniref:hypothetical protein n=1 Tax=Liquorilactobacillus hordei TaxID=468911 RepID=UPI0039EB5E54
MKKKSMIVVVFALVIMISAFLLIWRINRNEIKTTKKTVTNQTTTNTIKNYVKGNSQDVTVSVYGFNPLVISNIKTIYSLYRLKDNPQKYIKSHNFDDEQNIFLLNVLKSEVGDKDYISKMQLDPLSDVDFYFIKALQKKKIIGHKFRYSLENDNTELQKVLDGKRISKNTSMRFIEKYSIQNNYSDYSSVNNLLAHVLNLKSKKLTSGDKKRLNQVWKKYQKINVTKLALTLPDVSFVILGEFEKNLGEILHKKSFLSLKKEDIASGIFQPVYYQKDNFKNVAFLYAAEYYIKNNLTKNQDATILSELSSTTPHSAEEQYYLNIINKVKKDHLIGETDISPIKRKSDYKNSKFFSYLVENVQPEKNKSKGLLGSILYYELRDVTKDGKKFVEKINTESILNSSLSYRSQLINEYVLLLKKYNLITPEIRVKILSYINKHENKLYGYSLENEKVFTLESAVYALQVKSILKGGSSLDIH